MVISNSFQTLFAVPMECDACVNHVSSSLYKLEGIQKVEANLKDQLVSIEGTAAPSAIVAAIQATGRDAILRGSGGSESAAVCILETHSTDVPDKVRGLARMVQVSPNLTLIDLTVRNLAPGTYRATIRQTGDISNGAISTLGIWITSPSELKGDLGTVVVGKDGVGSVFLEKSLQIWEIIGRGMVISKREEESEDGTGLVGNDDNTLVGVVARSAGVWDNDKTVCSCSGKTLWEERKEEVSKGML